MRTTDGGVAAADQYIVSGSGRIIIILMTAVFFPADGLQEEHDDGRGLEKFTAAVVERGAAVCRSRERRHWQATNEDNGEFID